MGSFLIPDILHVVSTLPYLKIFHFPRGDPYSSDWGENQAAPEWPDRLEKLYIPCSLDPGYIRAFEKVSASLTSLTIENEGSPNDNVLDTVFRLIGPHILTLKVEYEELPQDQIANLTVNFPNLLHLSVRAGFMYGHAIRTVNLGIERPLRAITIDLSDLDDITGPEFLELVKDLLDKTRLPNIRKLMLSSEWSLTRWLHFWRKYPLQLKNIELFEMCRCLKRRSSSASDLESGIWLVDCGVSDDGAVCEFTEENVSRIASGAPV